MKTTLWIAVGLLALTGLVPAGPALAADKPGCEVNFRNEGSLFSGRRFSTWDTLPTVKPGDAFRLIQADGLKSGLRIVTADKASGMLVFEQNSTQKGRPVNLPWNIVIEPSGKGSKITVTKSTPPAYVTSEDSHIKSMCYVIDSARRK